VTISRQTPSEFGATVKRTVISCHCLKERLLKVTFVFHPSHMFDVLSFYYNSFFFIMVGGSELKLVTNKQIIKKMAWLFDLTKKGGFSPKDGSHS